MNKTVFIIIFLIISLFSCKPKSELVFNIEMLNEVPDSILQLELMIEVLTDVHLAESASQIMKSDSIKPEVYLKQFYPEIIDRYKISIEKMESSYNYYATHPLLMNYIYQRIIEKLNMLDTKKGGNAIDKKDAIIKPSNPLRPDLKKIDSLKSNQ